MSVEIRASGEAAGVAALRQCHSSVFFRTELEKLCLFVER